MPSWFYGEHITHMWPLLCSWTYWSLTDVTGHLVVTFDSRIVHDCQTTIVDQTSDLCITWHKSMMCGILFPRDPVKVNWHQFTLDNSAATYLQFKYHQQIYSSNLNYITFHICIDNQHWPIWTCFAVLGSNQEWLWWAIVQMLPSHHEWL